MSNVATRLLSLILLLQSRSQWKAAELADKLSVSERTIHRYMAMLDEMGIPLYSERGPYGGFSLVRGYRLPPLLFTAEEATVLYMGAHLVREVWGQTYGDAVTAATAKLDNVLPDALRADVARARQELVVGGLTRREVRLWEGHLDVLRRCVRDRRCALLRYRAARRDGGETERVVEPYALTFQWGLWYLVAHCRLRGEMRTFRVDRVLHVEHLEDRYEPPAGFDVREFLQETLWPPPDHKVLVRLSPETAEMLREEDGGWIRFGAQDDDGWVVASFGTNGLEWATGWVLSHGPGAEVLEPAELVERVRRAVVGLARVYDVVPEAAARARM